MMILTNNLKISASLLLVVLSFALVVHLLPNNELTIPTDPELVGNSLESVVKGYPPGHPRLLAARYERPQVRYTPWADLTSRQQNIAINLLEYTGADSWNNPMTNPMERMRLENVFEYLNATLTSTTMEELEAFFEEEMGFTYDNWDCWVNHYIGFTWDYFSRYGFNWTLIDLGWTETTWNSNNVTLAPPSESKDWDELTTKEQTAAKELCYTENLWDRVPIDDWVSPK